MEGEKTRSQTLDAISTALENKTVTLRDYSKFKKMSFEDTPTSCIEKKDQTHSYDLELDLIDTPGLDDSSGEDEQHLINILKHAQGARNITAIVFIIKKSVPYGENLIAKINLYRRVLPELANRFYVIHSDFSLQSVFKKPQELTTRKNKFVELFDGGDDSRTKQFFLDSLVDENLFEETNQFVLERAWSYFSLTSLLMNLMGLPCVSLGKMYFTKTQRIIDKETLIKTALEMKIGGYRDGIKLLDKALSGVATDLGRLEQDYQEKQGLFMLKSQELESLNSDVREVIATSQPKVQVGFLNLLGWRNVVTAEIKTMKEIEELKWWYPGDTCNITEKPTIDISRRRASVTVRANYMKSAMCTLHGLATKKNLYKDKIVVLRKEIDELKKEVTQVKEKLDALKVKGTNNNVERDKMVGYIAYFSSVMQFFQYDKYQLSWYLSLHDLLKSFTHNNTPTDAFLEDYTRMLHQLQKEGKRIVGDASEDEWNPTLKGLVAKEPLPNTLEEAIGPLKNSLFRIEDDVLECQERAKTICKQQANQTPTLNPTSVAAIRLYTLPSYSGNSVFEFVNKALRDPKRSEESLKKVLPFIKLLNHSLLTLPEKYRYSGSSFRGTQWVFPSPEFHEPSEHYPKNREFYWYAFQSSSCSFEVADNFCNQDKPRTIFHIEDIKNGFLISAFSNYTYEEEVLFPLLSKFKVVGVQKQYNPTSEDPKLADIIKLRHLN
eukprot:TRINITY_DN1002_c0_g1_i3.p1 TRINITY_DN1002_c0_g1~~TRINITY_DN1002_c0_g1_i3.p1  ORF type:complete len:787 (-),score=163.05 TRINITY_DN1002_c0_g1_i3:145-2304(-)